MLKILVGNKTDRDDREIPTKIGEEFAKQHDMYFLETSAKEAENVERLFYEIAAELIIQARRKDGNSGISLNASYRHAGDAAIGGNGGLGGGFVAALGAKAAQSSCCSAFITSSGTTAVNSLDGNNTNGSMAANPLQAK